MNLEDEILAVEEEAAKAVAAAHAEAKKVLGAAQERKRRIREEVSVRVEAGKARLAREQAASLRDSLAGIAREQARGEAAVEAVRGARVDDRVREIVGMLLKG